MEDINIIVKRIEDVVKIVHGYVFHCDLLLRLIQLSLETLIAENVLSIDQFKLVLLETEEFIVQFTDSEYILKSWIMIDHEAKFRELYGRLNVIVDVTELDSVKDQDEKLLIAAIDANLEKHSAIKPKENRVIDGSMRKDIEYLLEYLIGGDQQPSPALKQINVDFIDYNPKKDSDRLGRGGYGAVYKGRLRFLPVAVKVMTTEHKLLSEINEQTIRLQHEALILQQHNIPGVVRFFGVDSIESPSMIVMEMASYPLRAIHDKNNRLILTLQEKLCMMLECCTTISFLHSLGVTHRDISSANVMIMPDGHIKVIDFGISRWYLSGETKATVVQGNRPYLAPELLLADTVTSTCYDSTTEMYAFGILLNEVLTEQLPFNVGTRTQIFSLMFKTDSEARPELVNAEMVNNDVELTVKLQSLIERAWRGEPFLRIRFQGMCSELQAICETHFGCKYVSEQDLPSETTFVENVLIASSSMTGYYSGEMRGGVRHGHGILQFLKGGMIEADWKCGSAHGYVQCLYDSGDYYEGEMKNDMMQGYGTYIHKSGNAFEGTHVDDVRQKGRFTFVNDDVYEGEFVKDLPESEHGVTKYGNGDEYRGSVINGTRNGHEIMTYANGDVYEGNWVNRKRSGKGRMTYKSTGQVVEGEFKDDKFIGS